MREWRIDTWLTLGSVIGAVMLGVVAVPLPAAGVVASDNPMSGDQTAIKQGRKLFNTFCTQCHGGQGNGESRFGKYGADLRKFKKGYSQFVGIVAGGLPGKQMPPWEQYLDGDQISQIGAYLETLAIDGANWKDRE